MCSEGKKTNSSLCGMLYIKKNPKGTFLNPESRNPWIFILVRNLLEKKQHNVVVHARQPLDIITEVTEFFGVKRKNNCPYITNWIFTKTETEALEVIQNPTTILTCSHNPLVHRIRLTDTVKGQDLGNWNCSALKKKKKGILNSNCPKPLIIGTIPSRTWEPFLWKINFHGGSKWFPDWQPAYSNFLKMNWMFYPLR